MASLVFNGVQKEEKEWCGVLDGNNVEEDGGGATIKDPIIFPEECRQAIQWAEDAATSRGGGGWSTSRHYAVPTTDIPIHEIPPLLNWFNGVLKDRLRPLLATQFDENEVGKNGSGVYIHDAFIVQYDAFGGQTIYLFAEINQRIVSLLR